MAKNNGVSIEEMYNAAYNVGQKYGASDDTVDFMVAQWCMESANGQSELAKAAGNIGGLTQAEPTPFPQPKSDGNAYYKVYDSIDEYAEDYFLHYLKNRADEKGVDLTKVTDLKEFVYVLQGSETMNYSTLSEEDYYNATKSAYDNIAEHHNRSKDRAFGVSLNVNPFEQYKESDVGELPKFYEDPLKVEQEEPVTQFEDVNMGYTPILGTKEERDNDSFMDKFKDSFLAYGSQNLGSEVLRLGLSNALFSDKNLQYDDQWNIIKYEPDEDDRARALEFLDGNEDTLNHITNNSTDRKVFWHLVQQYREENYARKRAEMRTGGLHSTAALLGMMVDPINAVPFVGDAVLTTKPLAMALERAFYNGLLNIPDAKIMGKIRGEDTSTLAAFSGGAAASLGLEAVGKLVAVGFKKGYNTEQVQRILEKSVTWAAEKIAGMHSIEKAFIGVAPQLGLKGEYVDLNDALTKAFRNGKKSKDFSQLKSFISERTGIDFSNKEFGEWLRLYEAQGGKLTDELIDADNLVRRGIIRDRNITPIEPELNPKKTEIKPEEPELEPEEPEIKPDDPKVAKVDLGETVVKPSKKETIKNTPRYAYESTTGDKYTINEDGEILTINDTPISTAKTTLKGKRRIGTSSNGRKYEFSKKKGTIQFAGGRERVINSLEDIPAEIQDWGHSISIRGKETWYQFVNEDGHKLEWRKGTGLRIAEDSEPFVFGKYFDTGENSLKRVLDADKVSPEKIEEKIEKVSAEKVAEVMKEVEEEIVAEAKKAAPEESLNTKTLVDHFSHEDQQWIIDEAYNYDVNNKLTDTEIRTILNEAAQRPRDVLSRVYRKTLDDIKMNLSKRKESLITAEMDYKNFKDYQKGYRPFHEATFVLDTGSAEVKPIDMGSKPELRYIPESDGDVIQTVNMDAEYTEWLNSRTHSPVSLKLFKKAAKIAREKGTIKPVDLQSKLNIDYNKTAKLIDALVGLKVIKAENGKVYTLDEMLEDVSAHYGRMGRWFNDEASHKSRIKHIESAIREAEDAVKEYTDFVKKEMQKCKTSPHDFLLGVQKMMDDKIAQKGGVVLESSDPKSDFIEDLTVLDEFTRTAAEVFEVFDDNDAAIKIPPNIIEIGAEFDEDMSEEAFQALLNKYGLVEPLYTGKYKRNISKGQRLKEAIDVAEKAVKHSDISDAYVKSMDKHNAKIVEDVIDASKEHSKNIDAYVKSMDEHNAKMVEDVVDATEEYSQIMEESVDQIYETTPYEAGSGNVKSLTPEEVLQSSQAEMPAWLQKAAKAITTSRLFGDQFSRLSTSFSSTTQDFGATLLLNPRQNLTGAIRRIKNAPIEIIVKAVRAEYAEHVSKVLSGFSKHLGIAGASAEARQVYGRQVFDAYHAKYAGVPSDTAVGKHIDEAVEALHEIRQKLVQDAINAGIIKPEEAQFLEPNQLWRYLSKEKLDFWKDQFVSKEEFVNQMTNYALVNIKWNLLAPDNDPSKIAKETKIEIAREWADHLWVDSNEAGSMHFERDLKMFAKRVPLDTSAVMEISTKNGVVEFSYDDYIRDFDVVGITNRLTKQMSSYVAFKAHGINDPVKWAHMAFENAKHELAHAVDQGYIHSKDADKEVDFMRDIFRQVTGLSVASNKLPPPPTIWKRLSEIIRSAVYAQVGMNMGISNVSEAFMSVAVNGASAIFHYTPPLHRLYNDRYGKGVITGRQLKEIQAQHLGAQYVDMFLDSKRTSALELQFRAKNKADRYLGKAGDVSAKAADFTSKISGVGAITDFGTLACRADALRDLVLWSNDMFTSDVRADIFDERTLGLVGVKDVQAFKDTVYKYIGELDPQNDHALVDALAQWKKDDFNSYYQMQGLLVNLSEQSIITSWAGNRSLYADSPILPIILQFREFTRKTINAHLFRTLGNAKMRHLHGYLATAVASGTVWAGYTYAKAWYKFPFDEEKRNAYLEKKLTFTNMLNAGLWRAGAGAALSWAYDGYALLTGAENYHTTKTAYGKTSGLSGVPSNVVSQVPAVHTLSTVDNAARSVYDVVTTGEIGKSQAQAFLNLYPIDRYAPLTVMFGMLRDSMFEGSPKRTRKKPKLLTKPNPLSNISLPDFNWSAPKVEAKSTAKPQVKAETKATPQPKAKPKAKPQPKAKPKAKPQVKQGGKVRLSNILKPAKGSKRTKESKVERIMRKEKYHKTKGGVVQNN